jgi:putative transposase
MAEVTDRFRMRVNAFCLMSNHVHLAIQVCDAPLGRAMMRIASRYARTLQKQVLTTQHFFERRYQALLVDADEYLLELVRYIHLNPVRSHMVRDPGDYPWSGHLAYLGVQTLPWLTTGFTLSLFHSELTMAREAYKRFVLGASEEIRRAPLYGEVKKNRARWVLTVFCRSESRAVCFVFG